MPNYLKALKNSPIADGMGVTEDAAVEELRMDTNQALRIYGATHIVDVGFAGRIESSVITSAEGVENPSKPVLCEKVSVDVPLNK